MSWVFWDPVRQYGGAGQEANLTDWWTSIYTNSQNDVTPRLGAQFGGTFSPGIYWDTEAQSGDDYGAPLAKVVPEKATYILGFRFKHTGLFGALIDAGMPNPNRTVSPGLDWVNMVCQFRHLDRTHLGLTILANGRLRVNVGAATEAAVVTTAGGTTPTSVEALLSGSENYIEFKTTIHQTTGSYEVRNNGDVWCSGTNTRTGWNGDGSSVIDEIMVGNLCVQSPGGNITWNYRDFYLLDLTTSDQDNDSDDYLGPITLEWVYPTANGAVIQFTPSAGSNYQNVDDVIPDDDTTYNTSGTAGHIDTFLTGGVPVTGISVVAMGSMFLAKRTTAGASSTRAVLRIGGSNYFISTAKGNTQSYSYQGGMVNNLPSDHNPISAAEFDATEPGYEKTT